MKVIQQAVILAGGKGERLRPLTENQPKPMIPLHGKPFALYLVEMLKKNGIEEIVFLLGYLPQKVVEYFGDGARFGIKIKYSIGEVEENNGTRLRNAKDLLADKFILLYGDMYWPLDLEKHFEFYEKMKLPVMMTVYNNHHNDGEYQGGNVEVRDGVVSYYDEFRDDLVFKGLDIGYTIIDKSTLKAMPKDDFEFQRGFLKPLIAQGLVSGFVTDKEYCTITNIDFLKKAEIFLSREQEK